MTKRHPQHRYLRGRGWGGTAMHKCTEEGQVTKDLVGHDRDICWRTVTVFRIVLILCTKGGDSSFFLGKSRLALFVEPEE